MTNPLSKTSIYDRIEEYPNQHSLVCVNGQLRCNTCHESICVKKTALFKNLINNVMQHLMFAGFLEHGYCYLCRENV